MRLLSFGFEFALSTLFAWSNVISVFYPSLGLFVLVCFCALLVSVPCHLGLVLVFLACFVVFKGHGSFDVVGAFFSR